MGSFGRRLSTLSAWTIALMQVIAVVGFVMILQADAAPSAAQTFYPNGRYGKRSPLTSLPLPQLSFTQNGKRSVQFCN